MHLRFQAFDRRQPPLGTIYGVVLAFAAVLATIWLWLELPRMTCPLRNVAGLPCPTCGSTRMVEALLHGDLVAAFSVNPLVFLALMSTAIWALASTLRRVFSWPAPKLICTPPERLWIRVAALLAVLSGWAYVILNDSAGL